MTTGGLKRGLLRKAAGKALTAEGRLMAVSERLAALYQKLGARTNVTAKDLSEIVAIQEEIEAVARGDAR